MYWYRLRSLRSESNVPNATVMMVENAERFGLAQLHQLAWAGGKRRTSVLLYFHAVAPNARDETSKRLKILESIQ